MEKVIKVGDREVAFKATGATLRIYRQMFTRDLLVDIQSLQEAISEAQKKKKPLNASILEIFENVAYVMARQADSSIPSTPDEWLDGFDMLDIYQVLPQIVELWGVNMQTTSESKKKAKQPRDH